MKVLVYPNSLALGGSLNAVEIAAKIRDRGHDVVVFARPGPLLETVRGLGLDYVPVEPTASRRPSARVAAQLTRLVRDRGIDLVHAYEWPPIVEACAGPRLRRGVPVVATVYSTLVAPFLPRGLPLIVSIGEVAAAASARGHAWVKVVEPPVDLTANTPEFSAGSFRSDIGFDEAPLLALVGRLAHELKLEGILSACDAVGELAESGVKVQLAVVGDGPARPEVEEAAAAANARAGRPVVALTGAMTDPRPAYAAADVVLGMGGSALRGMAFGKPLVVQGERGFWRLLTPESAPLFTRHGIMYGLGDPGKGRAEGAARLAGILRALLADETAWPRLGACSRSIASERFSLDRAAALTEEVYTTVAAEPLPLHQVAADAASAWSGALRHQARRKWRRWRGLPVPSDDFNTIAAGGAPTGGGR